MAKTEVILIQNIVGLGGESDQVKVAAGYARNFLLPQGLAVPLTAANKRRLDALKQRRAEREAHELSAMTDLAKGLSKLTVVIKVKTGDDGKMFGSVTAGTIADEVKNQFEAVLDKRKIRLENPIRTVGDHEVQLHLHADVNTTLKVKVESTTPLAPKPPEQSVKASSAAPRGEKADDRRERKPRTDRKEKQA